MSRTKLLYPFSLLYGLVVFLRNKFFDWGFLKAKEYPVPVICVGNITVGGTGKTPHIEYLIELLVPIHKVAVLSRGYKRKTNGFYVATTDTDVSTIGDEAFQLHLKYPNILVAVDENRRNGIEKLLALEKEKQPEVILLDDAYQHRYVKAGYNILLMDYNRMPYNDSLLPVGNLREPFSAKKRADMVLVTKCGENIKPIDLLLIDKELKLFPYQTVFFTKFKYLTLQAVFKENPIDQLDFNRVSKDFSIILVTGIAYTEPLIIELQHRGCVIHKHLKYKDHYWYKKEDIEKMSELFHQIDSPNKMLLTTEKDAVKLMALGVYIDDDLKKNMFYLPISVCFLNEKQNDFDKLIKKYVVTHKRNRGLS